MSTKVKAPKSAEVNETETAAQPSAAATAITMRATELLRVQKYFDDLGKHLEIRKVFDEKLTEVRACQQDLFEQDAPGMNWTECDFKVKLISRGDRTEHLSFANRSLISDFLDFMEKRITEKLEDVDNVIFNMSQP